MKNLTELIKNKTTDTCLYLSIFPYSRAIRLRFKGVQLAFVSPQAKALKYQSFTCFIIQWKIIKNGLTVHFSTTGDQIKERRIQQNINIFFICCVGSQSSSWWRSKELVSPLSFRPVFVIHFHNNLEDSWTLITLIMNKCSLLSRFAFRNKTDLWKVVLKESS